ncbi:conserved phage C-terminal domain-containing protein [Loigolactobacillus jiayinensis]|uniref:Conserved phage C-terminal domain-containing protein n=1 Tax=Loigolactobacillus jiayinensis TaxID=2486016 RepID=A0ABW1RF47_9LACO|nr:conserved phage C-terminal domain-containing protein [Loigolactobacillus jiayinensis]
MAKGAFQTSREIFDSSVWTDIIKFRIFFYVYGNAVFAREGIDIAGIHLKRGQFLRSYRNLQKDLEYVEKRHTKIYSLHTIRKKIEQLVKEKRVEIESTDIGTLFTVVKYDEYQGFERYKKQMSATAFATPTATASEHQLPQQVNNNKNVKNDKKKPSRVIDKIPYAEIVEYLNDKTGKKFRSTTNKTKDCIHARWKEGWRLDDFKKVVDVKSAEWLSQSEMMQYLRPETLFGPKFEAYLNQKIAKQPVQQREDKSERIKRLQSFVTGQSIDGYTPNEIQKMVEKMGANLSIEKINKMIEIGSEDGAI